MVDILAIGAHPDDIEFGCGGILAKAAHEGKSIVMVDMTLGQRGTQGTPEERRQEGIQAATVIGAERVYMDFMDCEIFDSPAAREEVVKLLRHYRPTLVLAPLWKGELNHPDHLACGQIARAACRYARFAKILPEQPIHRPGGILHYLGPSHQRADFLIDVSPHVETWKQMISCHASQMRGRQYLEWVLSAAAHWGIALRTSYAQGLCSGNPVQIDDILDIAHGTYEV